uniref:SNF2_N domain-containing protein n=1 Tax=Echinococcus granulosus TaxID=6210 RepID=A0A068WTC6_ECHGR|nr:hypothetical protein EgrG_000529900 [Echinococcus granulosus]
MFGVRLLLKGEDKWSYFVDYRKDGNEALRDADHRKEELLERLEAIRKRIPDSINPTLESDRQLLVPKSGALKCTIKHFVSRVYYQSLSCHLLTVCQRRGNPSFLRRLKDKPAIQTQVTTEKLLLVLNENMPKLRRHMLDSAIS